MKLKILLVATLAVIAAGITAVLVLNQPKTEEIINTPLGNKQLPKVTPSDASQKLKTYQDPSGFAFSYPEILKIESNELTKNQFASLAATLADKKGSIGVDVTESTATSIDQWFQSEKMKKPKNGKTVKLADLTGFQYEQGNRLTTIALDEGVLFRIISDFGDDRQFWSGAAKTIVSSFSFQQQETRESSPQEDVGDITFEGEEIVE